MAETNTTHKTRILVVDDSQDHASSLCELLLSLGYDARAAYNGELAMSVIAEFKPRCVILDVHMPSMDGHELAQALRTYFFGDALLLIGMSGYPASNPSVVGAVGLVDHYFQKPIDLAALEAVLPVPRTPE